MSADLIDPQNIPQFTGDLEQLGTDSMLLTAEAIAFRQSGSDVHTRFQGLSACYSAPEADQLFATTAPVAAKSDEFADDLEKVAAALSSYETEVQPLVAKLRSLKQRAETFRSDIAGDDHWREDDDNVQLNNDLVHDVTAATTAFWQAEITCHNTITALVGGTTLILEDGAQKRLLKRGTSTYGFTADLLNQSDELPWGKTVEKERHGLDWLGHQVLDFGKGFVVDGVWGTIRGLGTFVGVDGWDAAGEAWTGLGKLATGLAITAAPVLGSVYWTLPEDKLPGYLRESRNTVKEAGKALVAWDEWGKNPARAGGAVTFNVLTTVFTGGAGAAAKGGAVARTLAVLGKTGRLVDPMTYLGKAAKFGTVKVADVFAGLRGVHAGAFDDILSGAGRVQPDGSVVRIADDIPVIHDNVVQWPDGTRLNLDDGSVLRPDGTAAPAKVELSAADRDLLRQTLPHDEGALVGAGDDAAAHGASRPTASHSEPSHGASGPRPPEAHGPSGEGGGAHSAHSSHDGPTHESSSDHSPGGPRHPGESSSTPPHGGADGDSTNTGGQENTPTGDSNPVPREWKAGAEIAGPARGKTLLYPNYRHELVGVRSGAVDTENTVILPETRPLVRQDLAEIAAGRARFETETQRYVVNGRRYGVEPHGRVFPVSGPGFVEMNRVEYSALKEIMRAEGDMSKVQTMFSRAPKFRDNPEAVQKALALYRKYYS
ncbi:hypothetical protein ABT330_19855 [Streptomyces sp. NPDC000658]|uniref:hypothetical protein n=1 Tax=Streptomyces sp. NPDC000658 TaxID=3154266 RepID=UPI00331C685E